MDRSNQDQIAYWNGEVGERWARQHRALDTLFAPLTDRLFAKAGIGPGMRVLDIGCGAGETAFRAAGAVGATGRVVAVDVSAPLLSVARTRDRAAAIDWLEADAESHPFPAAAFDRVLSRFGVMFFADSSAAFANLRRMLAPGASLIVLCWRAIAENPWVSVLREAVLPLVLDAEPVPADAPGPFRFAERGGLEAALRNAGFASVAVEPLDRPLMLGTDVEEAAAVAVELGPVARMLREREPSLRREAHAAVVRSLTPYARDGAVTLGAGCWLASASG